MNTLKESSGLYETERSTIIVPRGEVERTRAQFTSTYEATQTQSDLTKISDNTPSLSDGGRQDYSFVKTEPLRRRDWKKARGKCSRCHIRNAKFRFFNSQWLKWRVCFKCMNEIERIAVRELYA